jgi:hypothetical protein
MGFSRRSGGIYLEILGFQKVSKPRVSGVTLSKNETVVPLSSLHNETIPKIQGRLGEVSREWWQRKTFLESFEGQLVEAGIPGTGVHLNAAHSTIAQHLKADNHCEVSFLCCVGFLFIHGVRPLCRDFVIHEAQVAPERQSIHSVTWGKLPTECRPDTHEEEGCEECGMP